LWLIDVGAELERASGGKPTTITRATDVFSASTVTISTWLFALLDLDLEQLANLIRHRNAHYLDLFCNLMPSLTPLVKALNQDPELRPTIPELVDVRAFFFIFFLFVYRHFVFHFVYFVCAASKYNQNFISYLFRQ
jgi:hypothetical protein